MRTVSVTTAAAVALLMSTLPVAAQSNSSETYRQLNLFGDVFERVRADYVDSVSDEKLIESAINGMLGSLDPHSSYLNPKNYKDMQVQTRGEFGGLGIEVTMENGYVKVVSPIDDTPAYRAGLQSGDLITHIDKDAVQGMTLSEAVEKMRGRVNSDILLTIRRKDRDPFDVTLTRAVIKIQSVRSRLEGNDIGYIRITSFSEQTSNGVENAFKKLQRDAGEGKLKGLVLDLRNNPGGLLDQAVKVSDMFLDKGEIVSTRSRKPEDAQRFNAKSGDVVEKIPTVVLINGGSASASEIVAGALQDHRRAIVMGTRSFGKGSVQTIIPLGQHGAIRLTTAQYFTPSGRSIQAKGIDPDVAVEQARLEAVTEAGRRRERDLRGALHNPNDPDDADPPETTPAPAPAQTPAPATGASGDAAAAQQPQDYQLMRAVDFLRALALYNPKFN